MGCCYRWPAGSGEPVRRPGCAAARRGCRAPATSSSAARYPRDPWPASDSRRRSGGCGAGEDSCSGCRTIAGCRSSALRGPARSGRPAARVRSVAPGRAEAAPARVPRRGADSDGASASRARADVRAPAGERQCGVAAPRRGIPSTGSHVAPGRAPHSSGNRCRPPAAATHRTTRWTSRWAGTGGVSPGPRTTGRRPNDSRACRCSSGRWRCARAIPGCRDNPGTDWRPGCRRACSAASPCPPPGPAGPIGVT